MIKSMTGYGRGEVNAAEGRLVVEIKSVNHRYGEVFIKLPRCFYALENEIRKVVTAVAKRGKIEVFVQFQEAVEVGGGPAVNLPMAKAYQKAFAEVRDGLGLSGEITLSMVLSQKDVLAAREAETDAEALREEVLKAVRLAVENHDSMRIKEGAALIEDLLCRRQTLARLMGKVKGRAPEVVREYAVRIRERVAELLADTTLDEGRIAQEIALMADRCDITEELVRFDSHMQQFDATVCADEPVGRKLDFLIQEINREINTIGSKANDGEMALLVVELKAEVEKIREQVQNIE